MLVFECIDSSLDETAEQSNWEGQLVGQDRLKHLVV